MARLNDYAAPAESIDALKRRFVRQNREIARVNSMQSLRIRSLESEVSHLLAENVSLRKQVINLTQETERLEAGRLLQNGIYDIKSKLDAKLAELTSLATDLGSLPRQVGKLCDDQPQRPKLAPDSRPRMDDLFGADDGRLPAIVEDKYYPRRTLETQDLESLLHDDQSIVESPPQLSFTPEPELGDTNIDHSSPSPPEVTYQPSTQQTLEAPEQNPVLAATLETRKKKKKPSPTFAPEIGHAPTERQPSPPIDLSHHILAAPSKRKFIPEEDDQFGSSLDVAEDEFQFSRPSYSPKTHISSHEEKSQDQAPMKNVEVTRGSKTPVLTKRKVLEPKSANANLGSSKKACLSSKQGITLVERPAQGDENQFSPQKRNPTDKLEGKTVSQKPRTTKLPPSQKEKRISRPAQHEESNHTTPALSPHPNALNTEDGSTSRPSRRRGAVVSYAEPNLRDKMRRPGKEMADAVAHGSRRSSSFQPGQDSLNGDDNTQAQSSDMLGEGSQAQPVAIVSRRKRKVSSVLSEGTDGDSSNSIQQEVEDRLADVSAQVSHDTLNPRRHTRRHSSNPNRAADTVQYPLDQGEAHSPSSSPDEEDVFLGSTIDARRGRAAVRRKSMMV